jgi:hypothetical protein
MVMMASGDVVFNFCDTIIAKSECSVVILVYCPSLIFRLFVRHKRVYFKIMSIGNESIKLRTRGRHYEVQHNYWYFRKCN